MNTTTIVRAQRTLVWSYLMPRKKYYQPPELVNGSKSLCVKAVNRNPFGNGIAIFTTNMTTALKCTHEVDVGQGIQFYTQIKTMISHSKAEEATLMSPAVTFCTIFIVTGESCPMTSL
ncbi:hypothetical protein Q5P01_005172 [Channa striata]|uniref:Uncharacterized protein n=1 Tax=Channa striata TaxID=64152 RepID=A0AA88T727_CHASR|nr:hypothetical protein Q5P01_005172 [Channa striata]